MLYMPKSNQEEPTERVFYSLDNMKKVLNNIKLAAHIKFKEFDNAKEDKQEFCG